MKSIAAAIAAVITLTSAYATPRESVTFSNVLNFGRIEDPQNETRTATFTDAPGAYNATYLTITGTLTRISVNTYFTEASILVTPPSGTPFIVQPFKTTQSAVAGGPTVTVANTPAGSYTIPVAPIAPAGVWTFKFFERFNDIDGADSRWDNVTITLNDGPPPAPAAIGPVGHTFTGITVDGLTGSPSFDQTFTAPAGITAVGVRIRAQGTGLYTPPANNTAVSPLNAVRIRVTPPGGGAPTADSAVFPQYGPSSDIAEVVVSLPAAVASNAGSWRVEAFVSAAGFQTYLHSLAVEMVPPNPPTAANLGTLVANTPLNGAATVTATGQTKWFRFTLNDEISPFINKGLEIDTEGSTTVDATSAWNTSIGLYTSGGDLVASDYFDGTQSLGMLTFGLDNHPAPGDGQIYNGRDGAVAPGDYLVAVTAGDTGVVYQPGVFGVTNPSTQTGAVALHVRLVDPGAVTPPALDAGEITGGPGGAEHAAVHTVTLTGPNQVKWIRFTTATDTAAGGGSFLDIFTAADSAEIDTELGLYTIDGFYLAADDDDGIGYKSFLSFGMGGGPTVGDVGDGGAPVVSDGRDSQLGAGEYLLAVASYNAAFGFQNWGVTTTGTELGAVPVHFSTNLPPAGSACGPADIGVAGGLPGADGHLDNNDFIAFITFFFNQNPVADMGVAGGLPGSDQAWDNNDFIAFINSFFSGPASCR